MMLNFRGYFSSQNILSLIFLVLILGVPVYWIYQQQQNYWESKYIVTTDRFEFDNTKDSWRQHSHSLEVVFSSDRYVIPLVDETILHLQILLTSPDQNKRTLAESSIRYLEGLSNRLIDSMLFDENKDPNNIDFNRIRYLLIKLIKGGTRNWIGSLGFFSKKIPSELAIIFERESEASYVLSINFYGKPDNVIAFSYAFLFSLRKIFEQFNKDLKISLLDAEEKIAKETQEIINKAHKFYSEDNPKAAKAIQELVDFEKSFWMKAEKFLDKDLVLEYAKIEQLAELNRYPADQYFSYFAGFLQRPLWRMCQVSNYILLKHPKANLETCDSIYGKFNNVEVNYRSTLNFYYVSIDHAFKLVKQRSNNLISVLGSSFLKTFELPSFKDYIKSGSYQSSMKRNFLRIYYLPIATSLLVLCLLSILIWRKRINVS